MADPMDERDFKEAAARLPKVYDELTPKTHREWWDEKSQQYRFWRKSAKTVRPEQVDPRKYGNFIRVPFPDEGFVRWAFETLQGAELFSADFDGQVLRGEKVL